jgi:hypothetical protein
VPGASVTHGYATPGSQSATVIATDAGGLSSTLTGATAVPAGSALLTVAAPLPLRATVKILTKHLRELLKRGLELKVGCTTACRVEIEIELPGKLASQLHIGGRSAARRRKPPPPVAIAVATVKLGNAGNRVLTVKLAKKARKRLAGAHRLELIAPVRASNAAQSASASRSAMLR